MTRLVGAIDFSARGNSGGFVLDGWAEPEAGHRWTLGRESRVRLPVDDCGPDCVLVLDATPCLCPPDLPAQVVMLALDGRLLATVELRGLRVMAFPLPPGLAPGEAVLSLAHLSCGKPRAPAQMRDGQPLGLMVHSLRVFRLDAAERSAGGAAGPAGLRPGPFVRAEVERRTGLPVRALAERFESIGQGCQFGLVQRQCGAEPLGLLRFVDAVTSRLVDGLVAGFAGIEDAAHLALEPTEDAQPRLRWRQRDYGLTYDTRLLAAGADWAAVRRRQAQRLGFLRRKFIEDVASAEKIFVLTRGDCLSPSEALAISCALRLHGPATLLWATIGNPSAAGQVHRLAPGFLCGELGDVDQHAYAPLEVWFAVMGECGWGGFVSLDTSAHYPERVTLRLSSCKPAARLPDFAFTAKSGREPPTRSGAGNADMLGQRAIVSSLHNSDVRGPIDPARKQTSHVVVCRRVCANLGR